MHMCRISFNTMSLEIIPREWLRAMGLAVLLVIGPVCAFAAEAPASSPTDAPVALPAAPSDEDVIVSAKPLEVIQR